MSALHNAPCQYNAQQVREFAAKAEDECQQGIGMMNHLDFKKEVASWRKGFGMKVLASNEFRYLVVRKHYKIEYFVEGDECHIAVIWDCRNNPELLPTFAPIE